jgi:hypothetical protein
MFASPSLLLPLHHKHSDTATSTADTAGHKRGGRSAHHVPPTGRLAEGADIDLKPACKAHAARNVREELDSIGVHVFREFMPAGRRTG